MDAYSDNLCPRVVVVGAGGIGSVLLTYLFREVAQNRINKIYLIDGDSYDSGNLSRQFFPRTCVGMNKAEAQKLKLQVLFPEAPIDGIEVIPHFLLNESWQSNVPALAAGDKPWIIFSGVDNHDCRRILATWVETILTDNDVTNAVLVTGGNNEWDGNVHVYGRWVFPDGTSRMIGQPLSHRHPEILHAAEGTREGLSCQERVNLHGGPQTLAANSMAATLMYSVYAALLNSPESLLTVEDAYFDTREFRVNVVRSDEIGGVTVLPPPDKETP